MVNGAPKYPQIEVQLSGEDGNVFSILGRVTKAMRRGGIGPAEIEVFRTEAMSGNYDKALQTCVAWVTVL